MNNHWNPSISASAFFGTLWPQANYSSRGLTALLSAIGVMVLIVLVWAVLVRRPRKQLSSWSQAHRRPEEPPRNGQAVSTHKRRKWRRRRREHRPRNPTLAETGGLPPVRTERPPDPFP